MKGFTKKAGLGCLTAALALSVGLGVSVCVSAQQEQDVFSEHGLTVTMDPGAAIRRQVGDGVANGIRFLAVVPDAAYSAMEALEGGGVSVSYGMLIASAEDVEQYGALTAESVFGENAKYEPIEEGGAEPAGKGAVHHFEYETLPTGEDYTHPATDRVIAGELTDFSDDELTDELVGVAYAVYEDGSGAQYLFAKDNNNSVSMTYAAQVAVEKQLDSAENAFAATYIDKVPSADRQTTFTVEYLFEGENGAYAADPAVPAKTVSAELGEKTNLNSIPASFDEKPFFVPDEEKNAEHVPQTVYANGKRVVQAYYRKAEVTAIAAEVKQDAVFSSYMSVDAVAELFTVTATYEDGSEAPVADFTIAAAEEIIKVETQTAPAQVIKEEIKTAPQPEVKVEPKVEVKPAPEPKQAAPEKINIPEKAVVQTSVAAKGSWQVQLMASTNRKAVENSWSSLSKKYPVLKNHGYEIETADLGAKGIFYRLQAGSFADRSGADALCKGIKAAGGSCIVKKK